MASVAHSASNQDRAKDRVHDQSPNPIRGIAVFGWLAERCIDALVSSALETAIEIQLAAEEWRQRTLDHPIDADVALAGADLQLGDTQSASDQLAPYLAGVKADLTPVASAEWKAPARRPSYSVLECQTPLRPWREALAEYLGQRRTARGVDKSSPQP